MCVRVCPRSGAPRECTSHGFDASCDLRAACKRSVVYWKARECCLSERERGREGIQETMIKPHSNHTQTTLKPHSNHTQTTLKPLQFSFHGQMNTADGLLARRLWAAATSDRALLALPACAKAAGSLCAARPSPCTSCDGLALIRTRESELVLILTGTNLNWY